DMPVQRRLERLQKPALILEADQRVDHRPALEDEQGGDRRDAVAGRQVLLLPGVDLPDQELPTGPGGNLVDDRGDALAGATPWGPEVYQDRYGRVDDLLLKVFRRQIL